MTSIPESYRPIHPEPLDAREVEHIRVWLQLNRLRLNQRDAKRTNEQQGRETSE